jgi:hypothetical protein
MQENNITKLNKGDKPCMFVEEDGKHCPGKWRKKNLKAGETQGYCKSCNRKLFNQRFGLSRDEHRNLMYTC